MVNRVVNRVSCVQSTLPLTAFECAIRIRMYGGVRGRVVKSQDATSEDHGFDSYWVLFFFLFSSHFKYMFSKEKHVFCEWLVLHLCNPTLSRNLSQVYPHRGLLMISFPCGGSPVCFSGV